ncbi:MAG: Rab family GTPase [Candidatus Thorarchaeota archaeon]
MAVQLPSAKKNIAVIGNPGVGKTTFLVSAIHYLGSIGWAEIEMDSLPSDYAAAVDSMISGQPLSPTLGLNGYIFKFEDFTYKGSEIKTGWFGNVTIRVTDLAGDDYRHGTSLFKQAIADSFVVLFLIDLTQSGSLTHSLAGQVAPLYNAIQYIVDFEKDVKHLELVFTKRFLHDYKYEEIVELVNEQLGPVLNIARRNKIDITMFEIDSRGKSGRLEPSGFEPVFYNALCYGCKVRGNKVDVEGPIQS